MSTIDLLRQVQLRFPCRVAQIRDLYNLYNPLLPFPRTVLAHGLPATGKTSIVRLVLEALGTRYVYINAKAAISARQVWEEIYRSITSLFNENEDVGQNQAGSGSARTENLSILVARLELLFRDSVERVVIVLDGVDEAAKELAGYMPGVARLGEIIPSLSILAITTTAPHPSFLRAPGTPNVHFSTYTKSDALHILSTQHVLKLSPTNHPRIASEAVEEDDDDQDFTDEESNFVYVRFLSIVWDTFIKPTYLSLSTFKTVATELWQPFIAPILARQFGPYDVAKLIVHHKPLFQRDVVLVPSIVSNFSSPSTIKSAPTSAVGTTNPTTTSTNTGTGLGTGISLPPQLQKILTAAYLASYIPSSTDIKKFSKTHPSSTKSRPRKLHTTTMHGPNGTKYKVYKSQNRKIPRMLLPPSTFSLERLNALLATVSSKTAQQTAQQASNSDLLTAISTLCSLRLLLRTPVGGGASSGAVGATSGANAGRGAGGGSGGGGGAGGGGSGGGGGGDILDAGTKYRVNVGFDVVRLMGRRWGVEVEEFLEF